MWSIRRDPKWELSRSLSIKFSGSVLLSIPGFFSYYFCDGRMHANCRIQSCRGAPLFGRISIIKRSGSSNLAEAAKTAKNEKFCGETVALLRYGFCLETTWKFFRDHVMEVPNNFICAENKNTLALTQVNPCVYVHSIICNRGKFRCQQKGSRCIFLGQYSMAIKNWY